MAKSPHFAAEFGQKLAANGWIIHRLLPHDAVIDAERGFHSLLPPQIAAAERARGKAPGFVSSIRSDGVAEWSLRSGWEKGSVPDRATLALWATQPASGLGVLLAPLLGEYALVAVDIDIRNAEIAAECAAVVETYLPKTVRRIGRAPKSMYLFRVPVALAYSATGNFILPGDRPDEAGYKPHAVEFLSAGKQIAAFGVHPQTLRPYEWPEGCIVDNRPTDLPLVTAEQIDLVRVLCREVLAKHGTPVGKFANRRNTSAPKKPRDAYRAPSVEIFREAMKFVENDNLARNEWVAMGYAICGAVGDEGEFDFVDWSAKSDKYHGNATLPTWRSIARGGDNVKSGWGTIRYHAIRGGWVDPSLAEGFETIEPTAVALPTADEAAATFRGALAGWLAGPVAAYRSGDPDALLLGPPQAGAHVGTGIGKTTATIEALISTSHRVVFFVPSHVKTLEVVEQINATAGRPIAARWLGRDREDPSDTN